MNFITCPSCESVKWNRHVKGLKDNRIFFGWCSNCSRQWDIGEKDYPPSEKDILDTILKLLKNRKETKEKEYVKPAKSYGQLRCPKCNNIDTELMRVALDVIGVTGDMLNRGNVIHCPICRESFVMLIG